MLVSKLGFFGIPWRNTPFFDNKAAFQLGINQVLRRTTTELVDTLGRVRGTSRIDQNLQDARTALAWDEAAWYIGLRGPTRPTPSVYREAISEAATRSTPASKSATRPSTPAPTTCSSSSTASPATSAPPPTSCAARSRLPTPAGSTRAPTTASGSPMASSTPITAS